MPDTARAAAASRWRPCPRAWRKAHRSAQTSRRWHCICGRRSRSAETLVRINGRRHWNWVFQNDQVVIHVIRNSRAASVVADVLAGHRPSIWVSDLYSAQQGHADLWQVCLAHQLRDCQYAIEAGDEIFAPRRKMLLLRAVVVG